jgi:hypothetical protein
MIVAGHLAFGFVLGWLAAAVFVRASILSLVPFSTLWLRGVTTSVLAGAVCASAIAGIDLLPAFAATVPGMGGAGLAGGVLLYLRLHPRQAVATNALGGDEDGYD